MVWNSFWAENKKELDKSARRFMAVDANANATLSITNFPDTADETYVSTSLHPKDPSMGQRPMKLSSKVLLEKVDADDCVDGENIVLLRWGIVKITKKDYVNPNTIATTSAVGDVCLKTLLEGDIIQLERRGFYRVDRPYLGAEKPCVLYMIPDEKTKSMSGMSGKLAHY